MSVSVGKWVKDRGGDIRRKKKTTRTPPKPKPVNNPVPDGPGGTHDDLFNPAEHTVKEVRHHVEHADADEVQRVYTAEKAGDNRVTLVEWIESNYEVL